jgi:uncharacterized surface protein with fasciclin (FAS1) repeats
MGETAFAEFECFGKGTLTCRRKGNRLEDEPSLAYSLFSLPEYVGSTLTSSANYKPRAMPDGGGSIFAVQERTGPAALHKGVCMTDKLNLIETIANEDKFSTFSRYMGTSGANEIFNGAGPFTVFAPTNDAFGKIPDARMNELLNEPGQAKLKALLSYHILPTKIEALNLATLKTAKTISGQALTFTDSGGIKVNGSSMQARNIEATNGVIHALDTVLAPPVAVAAVASPGKSVL